MRFRLVVCGLVLGIMGMILFATVHALVIVPIWTRSLRGAPFAIAVGLIVTWAYHEYHRSRSARPGIADGFWFGSLTWLASLPALALGFGTRILSSTQIPWWIDPATVGLAALGGAILLWRLTGTRRGALAGAIALGILLLPNGGPMPIDNMTRGLGLPAGYLVIETFGGALLALLYGRLVVPRSDNGGER